MNGEPGHFGADFAEFARKTLQRADLLKRAVAIKLFTGVIRDTPVGDPKYWKGNAPKGYVGGRLRGNWNCSVGFADTSTVEAPDVSHEKGKRAARKTYKNFPDLGQTLGKMQATVETGNRNTVDFLANSLPYAARIEYEGYSRQARAGMVRRNAARIKQLISRELGNLKR